MKPIYLQFAGAVALTFTMAACIPKAPEPAPPVAAPAPTPTPTPTPTPQAYANWLDAPQTPGDWVYRSDSSGTMAMFGRAGTDPVFAMRCIPQTRTVSLLRGGDAAGPIRMTIRTETLSRTLDAASGTDELPVIETDLPSGDRLLDAMAITKGRFAVEATGLAPLYLPAWPEVSRVIEDCR